MALTLHGPDYLDHTHIGPLVSWKPDSQDTTNGTKNPPALTLVLHQSKDSDPATDLPDVRLVPEGIQGNEQGSGLPELQHLSCSSESPEPSPLP